MDWLCNKKDRVIDKTGSWMNVWKSDVFKYHDPN